MKKFFCLIFVLLFLVNSRSYAEDLIDNSLLKVRETDDLNMSGLIPSYVKNWNSSNQTTYQGNDYNLNQMRRMNPDFTTFPNTDGIIWLKHTAFSHSQNGGLEVTRLFVILGRKGLNSQWLNWNIQIPDKGSAEIIEASIYDNSNGYKISDIQPELDSSSGIYKVNFIGVPDTFIIVVSWAEHLPDELSIEGLCWFQEDLPVWESIIEITSTEQIFYKTFPNENISPEIQDNNYTWRRINLEPAAPESEILRNQKSGVAFSSKKGTSGLTKIIRNIEESGKIPKPSKAVSGIKKSEPKDAHKIITWLRQQPEINLSEGLSRKIPEKAPWTQKEKIIIAHSWLKDLGIESNFNWDLPFTPDENTPLCAAMFFNPLLEIQGLKNQNIFSINDIKLLSGATIFTTSIKNETFSTKKIPSSKASENKLSAIMELSLNENGMLNGNIRLILRGAWSGLLLNKGTDSGNVRGALLALLPNLSNYKDVKYSNKKGVSEISFKLENKPGVAGTGTGLLAILPLFEPLPLSPLVNSEPPFDLKFPFILEQNITLGLPKKAARALVDGKINKSNEKINYSEFYQNKRHRLITESRLEVNMTNISGGNYQTLQQSLAQWHNYSTKPIPVR